MVERLPSLEFLLELVQAERDKQLGHLDALDGKAGIILGFSGLLITLAPAASAMFRVTGVLAASAAAALALWSFWPRRFPVLEPSPLRTYLRAEAALTQLTVLDTLEDFVNEGSAVLEGKGLRLRGAMVALAVAVALFAVGIVVNTLQG
jgi:hypothetical protein